MTRKTGVFYGIASAANDRETEIGGELRMKRIFLFAIFFLPNAPKAINRSRIHVEGETVMTSLSSNNLKPVPAATGGETDTETRSAGTVAWCLESMAGPLAIGASGLTFFLAFTLTVPTPDDVASSVNPVLTVAAAEPSAETMTLPAPAVRQAVPFTGPRAPAR